MDYVEENEDEEVLNQIIFKHKKVSLIGRTNKKGHYRS